jgi:rod shape-determining protein MreD
MRSQDFLGASMRWVRIIIVAIIVALIETTLLPAVAVNGVRPDLAFIYVFFLALNCAPDEGFIAFWVVGLMKDMFSAGPLGAYALLYAGTGYEVSRLTRKLFKDNPLIQIAVAAPAAAAVNAIYLAGTVFAYPHLPLASVAKSAFICVVYTTALTPFLLPIMSKAKSLLGIRPVSLLAPRESPAPET